MEEEFKKAVAFIQDKSGPPIESTNEQKLEFYGLFKQSTEGAPKGSAPSRIKVVERAKFMAWKSKEKLSKEQAMKAYVDLVTSVAPRWRERSRL